MTHLTVIDNGTKVVVRDTNVQIITIGTQGPPGSGGGSSFYYRHDQGVAASLWTVNHNLGLNPNVQVFSVGGMEMWAEVLHTSVNQTLITFDSNVSGFAIFS